MQAPEAFTSGVDWCRRAWSLRAPLPIHGDQRLPHDTLCGRQAHRQSGFIEALKAGSAHAMRWDVSTCQGDDDEVTGIRRPGRLLFYSRAMCARTTSKALEKRWRTLSLWLLASFRSCFPSELLLLLLCSCEDIDVALLHSGTAGRELLSQLLLCELRRSRRRSRSEAQQSSDAWGRACMKLRPWKLRGRPAPLHCSPVSESSLRTRPDAQLHGGSFLGRGPGDTES